MKKKPSKSAKPEIRVRDIKPAKDPRGGFKAQRVSRSDIKFK